nr:SPOR domain-containing protein [Octadecabacter sp.]
LRATGFSDLSDARRFCAAMSAEGAACIPVVVR